MAGRHCKTHCSLDHSAVLFEAAYRAWCHFGHAKLGVDTTKAAPEFAFAALLHNYPNTRMMNKLILERHSATSREDNFECPHMKLPVSILPRPYVQAILNLWLLLNSGKSGGLSKLRAWWRKRRYGLSKSAIDQLRSADVENMLNEYKSYFTALSHVVANYQKECKEVKLLNPPPLPRLLRNKVAEKKGNARNFNDKFSTQDQLGEDRLANSCNNIDLTERDHNLHQESLMRIHQPARKAVVDSENCATCCGLEGITHNLDGSNSKHVSTNSGSSIDSEASCEAKSDDGSFDYSGEIIVVSTNGDSNGNSNDSNKEHNDENAVHHILMKVDDISCSLDVDVIETGLRGCKGGVLLIDGLLDAVAGLISHVILIRINNPSRANWIATQAMKNLSLLGYTASVKCLEEGDNLVEKTRATRTEPTKSTDPLDVDTCDKVKVLALKSNVFDWNIPCTCSGKYCTVVEKCTRHEKINLITWDDFPPRLNCKQ